MLVKAKINKGEFIQIYDFEYFNDLNLSDFGLTDIEEITGLDGTLPIYPLNDIILSQLIKKRTNSQRIEDLGLYTWADIESECDYINAKVSNLSRSQRELVKQRYDEISIILTDPKNGSDPNKPDKSGNNDSGGSGGDVV